MKLALALLALAPFAAHAQIFTPSLAPPAAIPGAAAGPRPSHGTLFGVDSNTLRAQLDQAPAERPDEPLETYGLQLSLPRPSGELTPCFIARSPVMEPALQQRFPAIQTYLVQCDDKSAAGRFELSPRGLTAMLRTTDGGAWMI